MCTVVSETSPPGRFHLLDVLARIPRGISLAIVLDFAFVLSIFNLNFDLQILMESDGMLFFHLKFWMENCEKTLK